MLRMCGQACQTPALNSHELILKEKKKTQTTNQGGAAVWFCFVLESSRTSGFVCPPWLVLCPLRVLVKWMLVQCPLFGGAAGGWQQRVPCSCPFWGTSHFVAVAWRGSSGNPTSWPSLQAGRVTQPEDGPLPSPRERAPSEGAVKPYLLPICGSRSPERAVRGGRRGQGAQHHQGGGSGM